MQSATREVTVAQAKQIIVSAGAVHIRDSGSTAVYKNGQELYFAVTPLGNGRAKMVITKGSCAC